MTLFPFSLPSALARLPGLCWGEGRNGYHPTCQPTQTRQARRPCDLATGRRRACHMHTPNKTTHTRIPHIAGNCQPGRQLCCAVLCRAVCFAVLCCDVAAAPAFCIARLLTGRASLAADPVSHVTQHLFLAQALFPSFLPCLLVPLCLPECLPAWICPSRTDRAGKCEPLPLAVQHMSSFNNDRLSEKRPANRDPQYPSPLPAAGRA